MTARARAAWSDDEQDVLLFENLDTGSVKVRHHHVDEFDADEDYSVTVGEFAPDQLRRALIPPVPLAEHVANKRPNPIRRWLQRGK